MVKYRIRRGGEDPENDVPVSGPALPSPGDQIVITGPVLLVTAVRHELKYGSDPRQGLEADPVVLVTRR